MCLVLVIIVNDKCCSRFLYDFRLFLLYDCHWVMIFIEIGSSNKSSLLTDEFVVILSFILYIAVSASERRHPHVKGVHCPRHTVDEGGFVLISETVNPIGTLFNGITLMYKLIVTLDRS